VFSFPFRGDVKITLDQPAEFLKKKPTVIIFFALPNGNTTEQTMGKKTAAGDDWHFDIQHIQAQTKFIRQQLPAKNIVVAYLENRFKSWPAWKQNHADHLLTIQRVVDTVFSMVKGRHKTIYLNGHSGGGSFIFGFLAGVARIPRRVQRICFLDSDYGYDSSYLPKIKNWLSTNKNAYLTVFAYNDSVALYNGKPLVSATGGTWYRSHLMLSHLSQFLSFSEIAGDSITAYISNDHRVGFFFKSNLNRGIYHTQQVELNGFIHSILFGTTKESTGYTYYGPRAYGGLIR
jgi:hypothetical protein